MDQESSLPVVDLKLINRFKKYKSIGLPHVIYGFYSDTFIIMNYLYNDFNPELFIHFVKDYNLLLDDVIMQANEQLNVNKIICYSDIKKPLCIVDMEAAYLVEKNAPLSRSSSLLSMLEAKWISAIKESKDYDTKYLNALKILINRQKKCLNTQRIFYSQQLPADILSASKQIDKLLSYRSTTPGGKIDKETYYILSAQVSFLLSYLIGFTNFNYFNLYLIKVLLPKSDVIRNFKITDVNKDLPPDNLIPRVFSLQLLMLAVISSDGLEYTLDTIKTVGSVYLKYAGNTHMESVFKKIMSCEAHYAREVAARMWTLDVKKCVNDLYSRMLELWGGPLDDIFTGLPLKN